MVDQLLAEHITEKGRTEKGSVPFHGKHTVDDNTDGSRTYRWRVRLIDFDQKSGEIVNQLKRVDYRVEFE